jgi:hypothetical protein
MNSEDYVLLEWRYTPTMFFEELVVVSREGVEIRIEGGRATARVAPEVYGVEHKKRDELHEEIREYFKAEQVMTHQGFTLERPSVTRVYADGRRVTERYLEPVSARFCVTCSIDAVITKADGTVVDTRKERLDGKRAFRDACARVRDDWVLRRMLASYGGAVNDPEDELIHLYEVRDTLTTYFKGSDNVRKTLCVGKKRWSRLGEIANTMPLRQGRHRGEHDELRDATASELAEARGLAREFIEAYVRWLDGRAVV